MARYFAQITEEELRHKIEEALPYYDASANCCYDGSIVCMTPRVEKDLSKVQFDTENFECEVGETWGTNTIDGFRTLENGMTYLGCSAGGDWEHPVFFIIYWDGKELRGYIPADGNTWNKQYKTAYGSEQESDKYQKQIAKMTDDEIEKLENKLQEEGEDPTCDPALIIADIKARILPR